MKTIELYWNDLTQKKQQEILDTLKLDPGDHNWDVIPIATLDIEEEIDEV